MAPIEETMKEKDRKRSLPCEKLDRELERKVQVVREEERPSEATPGRMLVSREETTIEAENVLIISQRKRQFGRMWTITFEDITKYLPKLTGLELKVLNWLIARMDWGNVVEGVPQSEIAEELGTGVNRIKQALKGLQEKGVVRIEKDGRYNRYYVSPDIAWKGSVKAWKKALADWNRWRFSRKRAREEDPRP